MIKEQVYMKFLRLLISIKSIIAIIGITFSTQTYSQEISDNQVAVFEEWRVFVEDKPKECWSMSRPKESINTRDGRIVTVKRGDILLFVNFRPDDKVNGQVSFTGGYPFAEGSNVTLKVLRNNDMDGIKFVLFTEGEWAWARSDDDDTRIISAMKKGARAVLTARSSRGTKTQDTVSLIGFTAAVEDTEKRCK